MHRRSPIGLRTKQRREAAGPLILSLVDTGYLYCTPSVLPLTRWRWRRRDAYVSSREFTPRRPDHRTSRGMIRNFLSEILRFEITKERYLQYGHKDLCVYSLSRTSLASRRVKIYSNLYVVFIIISNVNECSIISCNISSYVHLPNYQESDQIVNITLHRATMCK